MKPFELIFQENQNFDFKTVKDIKLKYAHHKDTTSYITIKGNQHVENLEDGKYFIKSELEWLREVEYNAKITEITSPKIFHLKKAKS